MSKELIKLVKVNKKYINTSFGVTKEIEKKLNTLKCDIEEVMTYDEIEKKQDKIELMKYVEEIENLKLTTKEKTILAGLKNEINKI